MKNIIVVLLSILFLSAISNQTLIVDETAEEAFYIANGNQKRLLDESDVCYFPIFAEENGALSNNSTQWSFGNGATGNIAVVVPFDCEVQYLTFSAETGGTSISINIMVNGTSNTTVAFTGNHQSEELTVPISLSAGDRIGFQTNTEVGAYTDARVAAFLKINF